MSNPYNKEIIEAIKSGSEKCFNAFVKAEFNNVRFFVSHYVKDLSLAEDIAQETFISLWNSRESIEPDNNLRSYVFTISKNKAFNYMRLKQYSCTDPLEKREIQANINAINSDYLQDKLEALELENLINRTYCKLPDKVRDVFILSRKFGLSHEQIAKIKGIKIKAVEYKISIGMKIFRERLRGYLGIF
ncbi:MAG: sigma-70 family RNA polymerase sigma factor [Bacteroidales bacterium]|nr:sigma-70 family RNA polymerase sigma factor [Bacteroidales bacterium]